MPEIINLSSKMEKQLPTELVNFMRLAGKIAHDKGQSLYLVGGVVRDLLLAKPTFDLDLVVEGDAINLAHQLAQISHGKVVTHPHFNTAKLRWDKWSVDIATARSETYAKPGALPRVKPSTIENDLSRRDFTINAMAIHLSPGHYGELLDLHGGITDLNNRFIRILHEKSFMDDATRIWRGLRYEQRLDFQLETSTLKLLKRDISMLDTISGDRIRHELELVLREESPQKALRRAEELNVLQRIHPSLKGNGWLKEVFEQAQRLFSPHLPPVGLYFTLLVYHLTSEQVGELISYLKLPRLLAQTLRDTISLKIQLQLLADPELNPSGIYRLLHGYSSHAIMANYLATDSPVARQNTRLFFSKLRYVKPALTGNDLKKMGIAQGPRIKEILHRLHEARLDGKITSKREEEEIVREWKTRKSE